MNARYRFHFFLILTVTRRTVAVFLAASVLALGQGQTQQRPELVLQSGHRDAIRELAFSPDNRWLASAGDDKIIVIWDLQTGKEFRKWSNPDGTSRLRFSPDGRLLIAISSREIRILEVSTGKGLFALPHRLVSAVAFSRRWLLSSGLNDRFDYRKPHTGGNLIDDIRLWDLSTGREVAHASSLFSARTLVETPDGRWLAAATRSEIVRHKPEEIYVWEPFGAKKLDDLDGYVVLVGHSASGVSLRFSSDARWLVSSDDDNVVKVWDLTTGKEQLTSKRPAGWLNLAPDNRTVWTLANDKLQLFDPMEGKESPAQDMPVSFEGEPVGAAAISADARWFATSFFNQIHIREVATGARKQVLGTQILDSITVSPDGRWLAITVNVTKGKEIRILEARTGSQEQALPWRGGTIAFTPEGRWLISSDHAGVQIWEVGTWRELRLPTAPGISMEWIDGVALSVDGRWIAAAGKPDGRQGAIKLWDLEHPDNARMVGTYSRSLRFLSFSPDSKVLAWFGDEEKGGKSSIRTWRLAETHEGRTIVVGKAFAAAFSPNGHRLAVAGFHPGRRRWLDTAARGACGTLKLVDVASGSLVRSLGDCATLAHSYPTMIAFSSNGGRLAVGAGDNEVRVWDVATGRQLPHARGHTDYLDSISFIKDGAQFVTTSSDGSSRIWNAATGEELAYLTATWNGKDWVVVTPEGLFDGTNQGMQELVAWRIGNHVYPPEKFFADYYTPGLLARIFAGERPKPTVDIASLKLPPEVKILSPSAGTAKKDQAIVAVHAEDQGGGIGEVRLFQNGHLVGTHAATLGQKTGDFAFEAQLAPGENVFRAVAVSAERVEGNDDTVRLVLDAPPNPALHILVVGINQYEDPAFNLNFARQDGEALARFFEQRGAKLFTSVDAIRLFDENATQANIRAALDKLAQRAKPEDLVIIYLAGHGITIGQQFYFLPHEMHPEGDDEETAIRKYGLSATALGEELGKIKALKQVLILDACQSEQALQLLAKVVMFRGAAEERKAKQMLARSKGVYLIAASTKQQYAAEVPELGHGVLTYALLAALGEKGTPQAPTTPEGFVTMTSLLQYVNQQVPELTQQYHHEKQYPVSFNTGMDFPLLVR